jgi:polyisoprenoid-binding protein YceI
MKKTTIVLALLLSTGFVFAQKKVTTSASITFDATTAKDALPKAENKTAIGSINTQTGDIAFEASVKNFTFSNPKMQEHFNGDSWMNSDSYPVFSFTGKLDKPSAVNFKKDGTYKVSVTGDLKVKDVTRKEKINGTITVAGNKISVAADFTVKLENYNISGQPVDAGKVSKEPKVTVGADFQ